jgi:hypothetical protein
MDPSPSTFLPGLVERTELAKALGLSVHTIVQWTAYGAPNVRCPCGCRKYYYDIEEVRAWREGSRRRSLV